MFGDVLVLGPNVKLAYEQNKQDFEATQNQIVHLEDVVCHTPDSSCTQLIYVMQFDEYYTPCLALLSETTASAIGKLGVIS